MDSSSRVTYVDFKDLQGKQEGVQNEQLPLAPAALSAHYIHCIVLAQSYACVHAPPLVPAPKAEIRALQRSLQQDCLLEICMQL